MQYVRYMGGGVRYDTVWHVYVNVTVSMEDGHFGSELIHDSKLTSVKDARLFCFVLKSVTCIENVRLCV